MLDNECGICGNVYVRLKQHLQLNHTVPNRDEFRLLLKWGHARTRVPLVCPICCTSKFARLDKHLSYFHKIYSVDEKKPFLISAKRSAIECEFKDLRATLPTMPMVSTLGMINNEFTDNNPSPFGRDWLASTPRTAEPLPLDVDLGSPPGSLAFNQPMWEVISMQTDSPAPSISFSRAPSCRYRSQSFLARLEKLEETVSQLILQQSKHLQPLLAQSPVRPMQQLQTPPFVAYTSMVDLQGSQTPVTHSRHQTRPPDTGPPSCDPSESPTPTSSTALTSTPSHTLEARPSTSSGSTESQPSALKLGVQREESKKGYFLERVIKDFRKFKGGHRRDKKKKDNAQTVARHCTMFFMHMLGQNLHKMTCTNNLHFLACVEKLRLYPEYLLKKGYGSTSIKNMLITVTLLYKHIQNSFMKQSRLTSSEITRVLYELHKMRADVKKDVLVRQQKVKKKKAASLPMACEIIQFLKKAKQRIPEILEGLKRENVPHRDHNLLMGYVMGYISIISGHRPSVLTAMQTKHVFEADSWMDYKQWQILVDDQRTVKSFGQTSIILEDKEMSWLWMLSRGDCCVDGRKPQYAFHTSLGASIRKPNIFLVDAWKDAGCKALIIFSTIWSSVTTQGHRKSQNPSTATSSPSTSSTALSTREDSSDDGKLVVHYDEGPDSPSPLSESDCDTIKRRTSTGQIRETLFTQSPTSPVSKRKIWRQFPPPQSEEASQINPNLRATIKLECLPSTVWLQRGRKPTPSKEQKSVWEGLSLKAEDLWPTQDCP